jgi:hypothetical protein
VGNEVGSGQVPIIPTFKGFRKAVNSEVDGAAKDADSGFRRAFARTGTESGKTTGAGFKRAFEGSASGFASASTKELDRAVATASRALSTARLKEQDDLGKVRVAQAQLNEVQGKYAAGSSQVLAAVERLESASRRLTASEEAASGASSRLKVAQENLASAASRTSEVLGNAGSAGASRFVSGFSSIFTGSFLGSALGNIAASVGAQIGFELGNAIRAGIEFTVGSVEVASDLHESLNAIRVVYGDFGDQILDIGKTSARTFGLSNRKFNAYAVAFSAFAKTIAGQGGDVVGTFKSIAGRATDFASVMNVDVDEAMRLFQSGLAGETEPLRRYGIDMSAASVEAFALAHGIATSADTLTEAGKQQARYGLLMEQTNQLQGDFVNTSDDLANKQRIQAALWDDVQAKLGGAFLPVAQAVTDLLADDLIPVLGDLAEKYGPKIAGAFEDALPSFTALADDILPKLPGLFEAVGEALPGIIDGTTAVLGFLIDFTGKLVLGAQQIHDFFDSAYAAVEPFGESLSTGQQQIYGFVDATGAKLGEGAGQIAGFFQGVGTGFQGFSDRIATGQSQVFGFIGTIGAKFGEGGAQIAGFFQGIGQRFALGGQQIGSFAATVGQKITEAVTFVGSLPGRAAAALGDLSTRLLSSGRSLIQGFINGIGQMFKPVGDAVSSVLSFARGFFPNSPALRGPFSGSGWTRLKDSGGALMDQWVSGMGRPDLSGVVSGVALGAGGSGSVSGSAAVPASRTVIQHITTQQTDPRVQVRQWGREAERAFAAT